MADARQEIANLDALLNSTEAEEALGDQYWSFYNWYTNTARDKVLNMFNAEPEEIPEPIVPTPPATTQFDTSFQDDPDNWSLLTNTRWDRQGMGNGIADSVATDGSGVRLADVIGDHNFLNDATFELVLTTDEKMKSGNQPFLIVHYNGHTFSPVFI